MEVLIINNRISKKIKPKLKNLSKHIKFNYTYITTDFTLTSKKVTSSVSGKYSGVVAGDDLYEKLRTVVPEGKYDVVIFYYGNEMNGIRVNYTPYMPLYIKTDLIQLVQPKEKVIEHEILHTFFHKLQRQQIDIYDNLDEYKSDSQEVALNKLIPYMDKIETMSLYPLAILTRKTTTSKETLGEIICYNGVNEIKLKTLELPWLDNKPSISCIPTGTYVCKFTRSLKFPNGTYEVKNVNGRSGIRIHIGNYYNQIQGCILIGTSLTDINKDGQIDTVSSTVAFNTMNSFFGKKDFTLVIK